ncbi:3-methyladenine DNA glycosylase [Bacillus coahuilensis m2-6]|uniref:3-methyladenine DNA glycosylase n=1 Tax=Bacillus coahuilensis p1.1.43 TaxID=1150625 RepID=A0A147K6P4_9BACI|nr:hypothetical protein [Bacillus coahuilensis]KUP05575.1 3-methyladenine DNA glycosylase [Bacillus coahuilensis p1.1.43]KUP06649.1 3-methyladenine DNA glycosylase [Bacillus coahuilensis m2-6]
MTTKKEQETKNESKEQRMKREHGQDIDPQRDPDKPNHTKSTN